MQGILSKETLTLNVAFAFVKVLPILDYKLSSININFYLWFFYACAFNRRETQSFEELDSGWDVLSQAWTPRGVFALAMYHE